MRLVKATHEAAATGTALNLQGTLGLSLLGMGVAFVAGLIGLKWLSSWLESGEVVSLRNLLSCGIRNGFLSSFSGLLA